MAAPLDPRLSAELRRIVGERAVLESAAQTLPYESDGLALLRQAPPLVVLPRTTEEAARVFERLYAAGVPIVARGAGTGLAGGATPIEGGVVVGTARMRDVLELNLRDRYARVQAGVVNVDLTRACSHGSLFYAPDPSSQAACTIGGNVANNSGGPHCFKYGATTRHVRGLVIVQHDGSVLDLSEPHAEPDGYDLIGLFVGSEGTFGLATEITVQLTPAPETVETQLAIFGSLEAACDAVSEIIAARLEPSALEILDRLTIEAVEDSIFAAGYPRDAEAVLLLEVEGSEIEVDATVGELARILRANGARDARSARDPEERRKLWAGRKGAFGAMGRIAPDLYVADAVVPRTKIGQLVKYSIEVARERNLRLATVFHAGDGNLHPNICYDRRDADEVRRVLEAGELILAACVAAGGSLTGEHGVGLEKLEAMDVAFTPADLCAFATVRDVWNPDKRLNPGKLVPVHACREVRTRPLPAAADAADSSAGTHGA